MTYTHRQPVPRAEQVSVAIVLLAAGSARRMGQGGKHKLLAEFEGVPLVRRLAMTAVSSNAASVIAVTGYRKSEIEATISDLPLALAFNPNYGSGMASSVVVGFSTEAVRKASGAMVMLADMPGVAVEHVDALISAFRNASGKAVVRAVSRGQSGNPVIIPRSLYAAVLRLEGDVGARRILETSGVRVMDVDIGDSAYLDVDTPEAVTAAGGVLTT